MNIKKIFFFLLLFASITATAQKNFSYTPDKPKPGDIITITYEQAGDIAYATKPVEGVVYQVGKTISKADDIILERKGGKYVGTIQTDAAAAFLFLGFSSDKKFDNNFNEGYTITLFENDKPCSAANYFKGNFYQSRGRQVGVDPNNDKALAAMEKEFELYPENRKDYLISYVRLQSQIKKDDAPKIIQREIETLVKSGLKDESDYANLESLYSLAKLPEQQKFIAALKKEKFPKGMWLRMDMGQKFNAETDPAKKEAMLVDILKMSSDNAEWRASIANGTNYKLGIAAAYAAKKDWVNFKKTIDEAKIEDKGQLASLYNNLAWEMQKSGDNLPLAEEMSNTATMYARDEWQKPSGKKPDFMTQKQWDENNKFTYAMYADTYAMVLYRKGDYKKGYPFTKEAATMIHEGKDPDMNNTYALLAEKTLPKKQYVKELEQFVMDAKSTTEIKDILKRAYVKDKKSEKGFDEYVTKLQKAAYENMLEELRKSMLNEKAPLFALVDIDGKKIGLDELRDKVVIVDFWATWCGPCKASFPGMQKMVSKFKDDPNVKFVFIDTWERGDEKQKNAAEFITNNKYSFHVLMDNEDKVVAEYKVEGIPTKFVIDKKGMIRFKAIGFDGSDDKLVSELTAMIDLASKESSKGF